MKEKSAGSLMFCFSCISVGTVVLGSKTTHNGINVWQMLTKLGISGEVAFARRGRCDRSSVAREFTHYNVLPAI